MRYRSHGEPGVVASLHEVIAYAVVTGASVHVVHLDASSTVNFRRDIAVVEGARKRGLDITVESYPIHRRDDPFRDRDLRPGLSGAARSRL